MTTLPDDTSTLPTLPIPSAVPVSTQMQQNQAFQAGQQPLSTELVGQAAVELSAEDGDTIESAWVQRVEELMHQHVQDPHELARQFGELKVQYLGQRYGKTLGGDAKNRHNG